MVIVIIIVINIISHFFILPWIHFLVRTTVVNVILNISFWFSDLCPLA